MGWDARYEFREEVLCEHVWFEINKIMWIILILFVLNLLIKGYSWGYSPYFNQGQLSRNLRLTAHLCGPLRANIDNDSHDSQKKKFITPAVHSKETLFGAPILPRDSVDRAVNSKLNVEDTNDHQSLAGLERSMPTEFRVNSTSVKGMQEIKENTEIVETVDTFRFTISSKDMERLSKAEASSDDTKSLEVTDDSFDGLHDAGQRLLADKSFLERLEGTTVEYNEAGQKVLKVEMDLSELEDILGYEEKDTNIPSAREMRQVERDMARAFSHEKMREAERQVELAVPTDSVVTSRINSISHENDRYKDGDVASGILESEKYQPCWTFVGADVKAAVGALGCSALLVALLALYISISDFVASNIMYAFRWSHRLTLKLRCKSLLAGGGGHKGRVVPIVSLTSLLVYIVYHGVQHMREKSRFAGIGYAVPSQTFLERILPNGNGNIF